VLHENAILKMAEQIKLWSGTYGFSNTLFLLVGRKSHKNAKIFGFCEILTWFSKDPD
jgi:hypothetical protein